MGRGLIYGRAETPIAVPRGWQPCVGEAGAAALVLQTLQHRGTGVFWGSLSRGSLPLEETLWSSVLPQRLVLQAGIRDPQTRDLLP